MKLDDTAAVLQGSCLAPLFGNLENVGRTEKEGVVRYQLEVRHPFDNKPAALEVLQAGSDLVFRIRRIAVADDAGLVARVAHVNHMTRAPKVCWDPQNGEVYLEWCVFGSDEADLSPIVFERIIAHMLSVFYNERLYFLATGLKKVDGLPDEVKEQLVKSIHDKLTSEFLPPVVEALGD